MDCMVWRAIPITPCLERMQAIPLLHSKQGMTTMKNTVLLSIQLAVAAAALGWGGLAAAQQRMGDRDVADGSSSAQEAAAARQAARRGQLTGGSSDQYMNHALARCAVFKMEEDKRACMDRVDKGQDSGSVQGGGILREYTYTVPAKP